MQETPKIFSDAVLFTDLVSYFVVPLFLLLVSWLLHRQFNAKLNAGMEFFVFLLSFDLACLAQRHFADRINPRFGDHYHALFVLLAVVALGFLVYAARVQGQIYTHVSHGPGLLAPTSPRASAISYYPLGGVLVCWTFAMAGIGFHLYVTLGNR